MAYKKCETAELLAKTSFFLYFRYRPKNGEGNKQRRRDVESVCARVNMHQKGGES